MQMLNQVLRQQPQALLLLWLVFYASSSASCVFGKTNSHHPKNKNSYPVLVPPPPPYMPFPGTPQYSSGNTLFDKHIYSADGYNSSAPIRVNKHITYWNGAKP